MSPGITAAVLLLLAAAALIPDARVGRNRLACLADAAPVAAGPAPVLRPAWAAVAVAAAGLVTGAAAGPAAGLGVAVAAAAGATALHRLRGRPGATAAMFAPQASLREDPAELAGRWPLLAVCLEAGLPVAAAVEATAAPLTGAAGQALRRVAGLLALGADPAEAWATVAGRPALAAFARAAGRSAGTGAALAQVARAEGARLKAELTDSAQARAQRAAVLITGPLGLCHLPAFLVLGIAPVVIGLASQALSRW